MGEAWKIAKLQLEKDFEDGTIPLDSKEMSAAEVHQLRPIYTAVQLKPFKTNLNRLRNNFTKGDEWKNAKAQLEKDLADGVIPLNPKEMDAITVYKSRPLYMLVPENNFKTNFEKLRKTFGRSDGAKNRAAWEKAKWELERDLKAGVIPLNEHEMSWEIIYNSDDKPHYRKVPPVNFQNNFKRLRGRIQSKKGESLADAAGLASDLIKNPPSKFNNRGEPRYNDSLAQQTVRYDVRQFIEDKGRKPRVEEIFPGREAYSGFARKTIRKKLYQEEQRWKFENYLNRRREEKEAARKN
jgi:hypothetical protein